MCHAMHNESVTRDIGSTKLTTICGLVSLAGARGYVAPKFNDSKRGVKTDVYSYGIVSL